MRYCIVFCIELYQRYLSSRKGFKCAHHRLYGKQTCSNAVKALLVDNGVWKALPLIRYRFKACSSAAQVLKLSHSADLDCGLGGCDIGFDGGGKGSGRSGGCSIFTPFELLFDLLVEVWSKGNKWVRALMVVIILSLIIGVSYACYGRGIAVIIIEENYEYREQSLSVLSKLSNRKTPDLRVLVVVGGRKIYSNIWEDAEFSEDDPTKKLILNKAIFSLPDQLEILDARIKVGGSLLVASQAVESFDKPNWQGEGRRFSYKLKRRWSF